MLLHKNPYFSVNSKQDYYYFEFSHEQVIILPVVDNSSILFVNAIRPLFKRPTIELPAGLIEDGEDLKSGALRELREETGIGIFNIDRLDVIPSQITLPNRNAQFTNLFSVNISMDEYIARGPHDDEVDGLLLMPFDKVVKAIHSGKIFVSAVIGTCLTYLIKTRHLTVKE